MAANVALSTIASIFLLLLLGYALRKLGVVHAKDAGVVNSIVINLALPAFIFVSAHGKPLDASMVKAPAVGFVMQFVVLGAAYLVARALKLDRPTTAGFMITSAFGNTGYLGIPVITAAFDGDKRAVLTAIMMDSFAMRLGICTVGIAIASSFAGSRFDWKAPLDFLKTPLFPAVVLGLALRDAHIPRVIMNSLTYLANATIPMSMIAVGLSLSATSVKQYPKAYAAGIILKMALLPALTFVGLRLIGVQGTVSQVAVAEMAMPSAVFSGVIAARFGANGPYAAGAIFLMTLASALTIPAVLILVQ